MKTALSLLPYIGADSFGSDAVFERQFLRLDGFTKAERIKMTARVSEAINQAGAWITDFHLYSNILTLFCQTGVKPWFLVGWNNVTSLNFPKVTEEG